MQVIKKKSEHRFNICLKDNDKYLVFTFGGNGDLYWTFMNHSVDDIDYSFTITKENFEVYKLFVELFDDIKNINLYDFDENLFMFEKLEEKIKYRLYNYSHYNELYDAENDIITWHSDETSWKLSNILKIKKEDNTFKLEFYTQPYIQGYDEDFHSIRYIKIRFRNSGSLYAPFNNIFMKMYNKMSQIDDIYDFGHQIHLEEYLFQEEKAKKLSKNK